MSELNSRQQQTLLSSAVDNDINHAWRFPVGVIPSSYSAIS